MGRSSEGKPVTTLNNLPEYHSGPLEPMSGHLLHQARLQLDCLLLRSIVKHSRRLALALIPLVRGKLASLIFLAMLGSSQASHVRRILDA